MRREMKEKEHTARGQEIEKIMIEGRIVPAEITVALLLDAIRENMAKGNTQFLVDGSVGTVAAATAAAEVAAERGAHRRFHQLTLHCLSVCFVH